MNDINFDTSVYDERQKEEELKKQQQQAATEAEMAEPEQESATATPAAQQPQQEEKKEEEGEFLDGMMEDLGPGYAEQGADGKITTDEMGGKQRAVAGAIDTVMDLTSKFIPAMKIRRCLRGN